MAAPSSLFGIRVTLAAKDAQKDLARQRKFAGDPEGLGFNGPIIVRPMPRGFPPTGFPPTGFPPPRPTFPISLDPGSISQAEAGCRALSGVAQDLCLLGIQWLKGRGEAGQQFDPQSCPTGTVRVGKKCIDLTALPPGGDPAMFPANGVATVGAFGLPALTPGSEERLVRKCGRGMVLGIDDLCYPKAVLPPRSKFRKWRRPPRAPVTRRDVVAIRRAAGARERVLELAKDVGLSLSQTKTRRKKKATGAHKH